MEGKRESGKNEKENKRKMNEREFSIKAGKMDEKNCVGNQGGKRKQGGRSGGGVTDIGKQKQKK